MKTKSFFLTLLLAAMIFVPAHLSAQVTIGSDRAPSPWALLDLDNSERVRNNEQPLGLHLPRLDEEARYDLDAETAGTPAQGLMIFNIDNECLEFWSGTAWISLCEGDEPPFLTPPHFNLACRENPAFAECFAALRRFNSTVRRLADVTNPSALSPVSLTAAGVGFNMLPVTGGVFYKGSQQQNSAHPNFDNNWSHGVIQTGVHSFYMMETLVTAELFAAVMGANGTFHGQLLTSVTGLGTQWGSGVNIPRNGVNWFDAVVFANRLSVLLGRDTVYSHDSLDLLNPPSIPTNNNATWNAIRQNLSRNGFRLPTEAEWEYAARGGQRDEYTRTLGASGTLFRWSGSNNVNDVAWHRGGADGYGGTHPAHQGLSENQPVGALASNQLGLYDMSGLLREWTWDWHLWPLEACCALPPRVVNSGGTGGRVMRSASWDCFAAGSQVPGRQSAIPGVREYNYGFRLAFSAVE